MAQIKEFSSADLNTISRFGGVSNTLEKINGVTVIVPSGTFLLDTTYGSGAAAAYSLRKLKTGVTVAARIRRSGDDIEADVEFDSNNEISLTSPISNASSGTYTDLSDFVDHTGTARDAFVDEWKDQSGNANHAYQNTEASQPKLYDATTGLITEGSKPALDHDGSGWLTLGVSDLSNTNLFAEASDPFAVMCVAKYDTSGEGGTIFSKATSAGGQRTIQLYQSNGFRRVIYRGQTNSLDAGAVGRVLQEAHWSGSAATIVINGTESSATVGGAPENSDNINIGSRTDGAFILDGKTQEIIVWGNAQDSTNRAAIRTNMNNYFSIYS